jgi:hypothetical protein
LCKPANSQSGLLGLFALLCGLLGAPAAWGSSLEAAQQAAVRAATFEVVVLKPADDPLSYAKALPMELLPYQYRTDKYYSVGTAFAIAPHRYATAAHVFEGLAGMSLGPPALRDDSGHIYPIAEIVKFSQHEDFVVFSLAQEPAVAPIAPGPHPAPNDVVFVVGNALAEGVVFRDGLYTSETPEERDGLWKWLRFSAAASPGNSGGPLVNQDGKVIGIVLRKSPSENLNYAVSIDQVVAAKEGVGIIDAKATYQLDVFNELQTDILKETIALPLSFDKFSETLTRLTNAFEDRELAELLKNNADTLFPNGVGSHRMLNQHTLTTLPGLIRRKDDGVWDIHTPSKTERQEIPHNGYVTDGILLHQNMMHVRRPEEIPADKFYADPKLYMELVLKGLRVVRVVGSEPVRITSMGKPVVDTQVVDSYGRKWLLREWPMSFENKMLVQIMLPVPDGAVAMTRLVPINQVHAGEIDLKAMTNFVSANYSGTLAQWQEFLKPTTPLPALFSTLNFKIDYDHGFAFETERFALSLTPDLQKISPKSFLSVSPDFIKDGDQVVLNIGLLTLKEYESSKNHLTLWRALQPPDDLGDSVQAEWAKRVNREHPYDAAIAVNNDVTSIETVYPLAGSSDRTDVRALYLLYVSRDGAVSQDSMKAKLDLVLKGFQVREQ